MPAGGIEEKAALRRRIKALPRPDWAPLLERFLALPELDKAQAVLLFCGVGDEPDTAGLIGELLRRGKGVALPVCLPGRRMEARAVTSLSDLRPGAYGIPEPGADCSAVEREKIDLILVPNLCCDRWGYRLGHGGGYYDRYLAGYGGLTVALCPQDRLQTQLPREEHDWPMGLVLTETGQWRGDRAPRPAGRIT